SCHSCTSRLSQFSCFYLLPLPPSCTLFPYTTLFRSSASCSRRMNVGAARYPASSEQKRLTPARPARRPARTAASRRGPYFPYRRSEEHTSELQSPYDLVCRLLLEKKKDNEDSDSRIV